MVVDGLIYCIDWLGVCCMMLSADVDVLKVRLRAPFQIFHLLPLGGMFEAHVVANGVGVGETSRADVHGTDGGVAGVVHVYVLPDIDQSGKVRFAQRALEARQIQTSLPRRRVLGREGGSRPFVVQLVDS